ncbi:TKL protein kinase [Thecamonas trahens ATCC 50062]|uniref:TKL protein kinase n=1 Tax=Thecamonas trahens ATCC 50062 TaxID=461836 RepID=A0A0L0DRZ1_THETB|nr:TKL protein kinase [Thecamonas trahens ATCC 50062]KNC55012.1 TKL protein kinase [Thecamonas trahens ATCC 50062]|eukprot:XP_013753323.1 TKL protein kinase [Thecamonas trahens ATCC 50062]
MLLGLAMAFNGRLVAAASVAPQLRVFGLHVGSPAAQAGLDEAVQLWNDVKSNSSSTGSIGPWPSPAPPPPPNSASAPSALIFPLAVPPLPLYASWLGSAAPPDIISVYPLGHDVDDETLIAGSVLLNITGAWVASDLAADIIGPFTSFALPLTAGSHSVAMHTLPLAAEAGACIYSRPIFAAHSLSPPNTLDELLDLCAALVHSGTPCLTHVSPDTVPPTDYVDFLALRLHGPAFYDAFVSGNVSFTTDSRLSAVFDQLLALIDAQVFAAPRPDGRLPSAALLGTSQAAIVCGAHAAADIAAAAGISHPSLGAFPFPRVHPTGAAPPFANSAQIGAVVSLLAPDHTLFPDTVIDLLSFLGSHDAAALIAAMPGAALPARASVAADATAAASTAGDSLRFDFYSNVLSASSILPRSATLSGYDAVYLEWAQLLREVYSAATSSDARAAIDRARPALEVVRLAAVSKLTAPPEISPAAGEYSAPVVVSLTCPTPNAIIRYSLSSDLSPDDPEAPIYIKPFELHEAGIHVVYAVASAPSLASSELAVRTFNVVSVPSQASGPLSTAVIVVVAVVVVLVVCGIVGGLLVFVVYRRRFRRTGIDSNAPVVIRADELALIDILGRGSFGTCYVAQWTSSRVTVQDIDKLCPKASRSALKALVADVMTLTPMRHPNINTVLGLSLSPPALVVETADRGSLSAVVHNAELALDASIVLHWVSGITSGLHFLAQAHVAHGDFNATRVVLNASWLPRITDFGLHSLKPVPGELVTNLAAGSSSSSGTASATSANNSTGNSALSASDEPTTSDLEAGHGPSLAVPLAHAAAPRAADVRQQARNNWAAGSEAGRTQEAAAALSLFMAPPEILERREIHPSSATDAYALGMVMWEMATRMFVFHGESPLAMISEVLAGSRPELAAVTDELDALRPVMAALWAASPADRLTLDGAVAHLARIAAVSATDIVYPCPAIQLLPKPSTTLVRVELREAIESLVDTARIATSVLEDFHNAMPQLAARIGATLVEWDLGVIHLALDDLTVLPALIHAISVLQTATGPITLLASAGSLELCTGGRGISGTAVDELNVCWRAMFTCANRLCDTWPQYGDDGGAFATAAVSAELEHLVHDASLRFMPIEYPSNLLAVDVVQIVREAEAPVEPHIAGTPNATRSRLEASRLSISHSVSELPMRVLAGAEVADLIRGATFRRVGSYARVYEAQRPTGPRVLIKLLLRQPATPLELLYVAHEGAVAGFVRHPTVVRPTAMCLERPLVAFIYPMLPGGSLGDVFAAIRTGKRRPLTDPIIQRVGQSIVRALGNLHSALGRGHGSLTPSNIVFDTPIESKKATARLTDYGLDYLRCAQGAETRVPCPSYTSPEALAGAPPSPAADIFVLGSILYELATSRIAFPGSNVLDVCHAIRTGTRPSVSAIPSLALAELIDECWAADADVRPSIEEIASEMARL